jgi:hypothetical protein
MYTWSRALVLIAVGFAVISVATVAPAGPPSLYSTAGLPGSNKPFILVGGMDGGMTGGGMIGGMSRGGMTEEMIRGGMTGEMTRGGMTGETSGGGMTGGMTGGGATGGMTDGIAGGMPGYAPGIFGQRSYGTADDSGAGTQAPKQYYCLTEYGQCSVASSTGLIRRGASCRCESGGQGVIQ